MKMHFFTLMEKVGIGEDSQTDIAENDCCSSDEKD